MHVPTSPLMLSQKSISGYSGMYASETPPAMSPPSPSISSASASLIVTLSYPDEVYEDDSVDPDEVDDSVDPDEVYEDD